MENTIKRIEHIFMKGSGTLINRCYAIHCLIEEHGADFGSILKYVFENYGYVESDNTDPALLEISKTEQEELKNNYGDIVNGIIMALIKRSFENETDFYTQLWQSIVSPIFDTKNAKVFALYYTLIDKRLPYYSFDSGVKMISSEWIDRQKALVAQLRKIKFVLNNRELFEYKTETGSHLLDIILSAEDYTDRVVLLTYLIEDLRDSDKDIADMIERLRSR